jgi:hypothetical protein
MPKKSPVEFPWKTNFRIVKALPDIKAVRSAFFVNFAVITLTIILLTVWAFFEWQAVMVGQMLLSNNAEIAKRKKDNTELLRQSSEFERWASLINEIQGFVGLPMKPSQFLSAVGSSRSPRMLLSGMAYHLELRSQPAPGKKAPTKTEVYVITLTGSVTGSGDAAAHSIQTFRAHLEGLDVFRGKKFLLRPTLKSFEGRRIWKCIDLS